MRDGVFPLEHRRLGSWGRREWCQGLSDERGPCFWRRAHVRSRAGSGRCVFNWVGLATILLRCGCLENDVRADGDNGDGASNDDDDGTGGADDHGENNDDDRPGPSGTDLVDAEALPGDPATESKAT